MLASAQGLFTQALGKHHPLMQASCCKAPQVPLPPHSDSVQA